MTSSSNGELPFDRVRVGDRFGISRTVTDAEIALFATLSGDLNPLHLSETAAKASRYGVRIASGQHTTALCLGAVATYCNGIGKSVGLEFSVHLDAAVKAGDTLEVEWRVVEKIPKPRSAGGLVLMAGTATTQDGVRVATLTGKALFSENL